MENYRWRRSTSLSRLSTRRSSTSISQSFTELPIAVSRAADCQLSTKLSSTKSRGTMSFLMKLKRRWLSSRKLLVSNPMIKSPKTKKRRKECIGVIS